MFEFSTAQLIFDIPDQYADTNNYAQLNIHDYINSSECLQFNYDIVSYGGLTDGAPQLAQVEYNGYRENMTATIKIRYSGFNFNTSINDKIWIEDSSGNITEFNGAFDDPFNNRGHLFFLNVKGDFNSYNAKLTYYSHHYDQYVVIEDAFEYSSNKILGSVAVPHIIDIAPIQITTNGNLVDASIIGSNYMGNTCMIVLILDCNSNYLGADQFCFGVGTEECPLMKTVSQSELDMNNAQSFTAIQLINSTGVVENTKNILFSTQGVVELLPGFEVKLGGRFRTDNVGCP